MNGNGSEPAIDVRGLTKSYSGRRVVDDFTMRVERGRIYGFLGPNGSGKTTTIRMLCGLLTPDAGEGTCLGLDLRTQGQKIKTQVGYMTQRFSLYDDLSIEENLDFIAHVYEVADRESRVERTLESLQLAGRRKQPAGSLSGGWKQRLALAACLIHDPKLLLLDEPTAGVDPKARRDFWDHIHELAAHGMTVLVSTHYMDEAERCHALVYIAYGKVVARGTADEIVRDAKLSVFSIHGDNLAEVANSLRDRPGVEFVIPFGNALHVGGADRAAVERALAPRPGESPMEWQEVPTNLEHVFIRLMDQSVDNFAPMSAKVEHPHFSVTRMLAVLMKEFRHMRRDGVTLRLVVALPLMQLILFGYAINGDPKHLPTAVVAADASEFSRSFIEGMRNSRYFEITRQLNSETEGDRLLAQGRVKFLVVIPADFGRTLMRGEKPVVLVAADATDPSATGNAISSLTQIAQRTLGRDLVGVATRAGTFAPPPVEIRVQSRYNPDGITQYNTVPGLMAVVLSLSCTLLTSIAVTKEREKGTLENLLATPVRPLEFMAGKVLPYVVVGYTQAIICLAFARLLFGVPFEGSFLLLMIMTGVFILASLAVGFTFSTLAQTQMQAMQMSQFFFLPGMLLSGFMFPFEGMPKFAQWIGSLLPMTHFLRIVRGIMLKDNGLMDVLPHFWPLLAFTVVAVVIALTRYRQTLD